MRKKRYSRILAVVLAASLAMSTAAVPVFAEGEAGVMSEAAAETEEVAETADEVSEKSSVETPTPEAADAVEEPAAAEDAQVEAPDEETETAEEAADTEHATVAPAYDDGSDTGSNTSEGDETDSSSEETSYRITVAEVENGSIKVTSPAAGDDGTVSAKAGDTVKFTVGVEDEVIYNSVIPSVTVSNTENSGDDGNDETDDETTEVKVTTADDGSYSFTMPAQNVTISAAISDTSSVVTINDANLAAAVRTALGIDNDVAITRNRMLKLTGLKAENAGITDLTGLEYARNLEVLDLSGNDLSGKKNSAGTYTYPAVQFGQKAFQVMRADGSGSPYPNLQSANLSGCGIGKNGFGDSSGNFLSFMQAFYYCQKLETLDLSNNGLYGSLSFPTRYTYGNVQFLTSWDCMKYLNLSDNDLWGITFATAFNMPVIENINLSRNRFWVNENSGTWFSNAVSWGLEKYDFSDQKSVAQVRAVTSTDVSDISIDDDENIIDIGSTFSQSVTVNFAGYAANNLLSGTVQASGDPVESEPEEVTFGANVTLTAYVTGENTWKFKVEHQSGGTAEYTIKLYCAAVPSSESEYSAGITDRVLQSAVITALNKQTEYQGESALDATTHVVTKEEMAKLPGMLSFSGAEDLNGLQYATRLTGINASNLKMAGKTIDVSAVLPATALSTLTLNGEYAGVINMDKLTNVKTLSLTDASDSCELTGMEGMTSLTRLTVSAHVSGTVDVSKLTKIQYLYLYTDYTAITGLGSLTALKTLALTGVRTNGQSQMGLMSSVSGLEELSSTVTNVTLYQNFATAPDLSKISKLRFLYISVPSDGSLPALNSENNADLHRVTIETFGRTFKSDAQVSFSYESFEVSISGCGQGEYKLPGWFGSVTTAYGVSFTNLEEGQEAVVDVGEIGNHAATLSLASAPDAKVTLTGSESGLSNITATSIGELNFSCTCSNVSSINTSHLEKLVFGGSFSAENLSSLSVSYTDELTNVLEKVSGFSKLQELKIINAHISDLTVLDVSNCVELQSLTLQNCITNGILDVSKMSSGLKSIDIRWNGISQLEGTWPTMTQLQSLNLASNSLTSIDVSSLPSSLTSLDLSNNSLKEINGTWPELNALKSFNIQSNSLREFPSAGIQKMTALSTLNVQGNYYTEIEKDAFQYSSSLSKVVLGNWLPVVREGTAYKPLPGSATEEALNKLKEVSSNASISIVAGSGSSYAALSSLLFDVGTLDGTVFSDRSLTLTVPADVETVTMTMEALLSDTVITIDGENYKSGDSVVIPIREGNFDITINTHNDFGSDLGYATDETYTLNILSTDYIEDFEPTEGHTYTAVFALLKNDGSESMANSRFYHNATVKYAEGQYDIRFTTNAADLVPAMNYIASDGTEQAADVVSEGDGDRTFRIYADSLENPITVRPCVVPMGNTYVSCYMHFDLTKVIDITDFVGADKANLNAAITKAKDILAKGNIYTTKSYKALVEALDDAEETATLETPKQSTIDKAAETLTAAMGGLVEDPAKLADITALNEALANAKSLEKGNHTDSSWETLQEAIADAQAVADDHTSSQSMVDLEASALEKAMQLFSAGGTASTLDASNLADGEYSVYVDMINASNTDQKSMSDKAVTKPIKITVKDGQYYATVTMHGINITLGDNTLFGYLKELSYWDGSEYQPVTVDSTYDVVDTYNDADGDGTADYSYPKQMTFPLENKNLGDTEEGLVKVQVFVPIMEAISAGSGTQQALMKIDWTSLTAGASEADEASDAEDARNALISQIAAAKNVASNTNAYTADSLKVLTDAIAAAEKVASNAYSTKAELQSAASSLTTAIAGLVKASGTTAASVKAATTATGAGSLTAMTTTMTARKSDAEISGSTYRTLKLRSTKQTKTSITVKWTKVTGAKSYTLYGAKCGSKYKVLKSTTGTSYKKTKLKKGTYYKYVVVASDANGKVLAISKVIHVATKGGKVGNYKSVKIKSKKTVTLAKKGKTSKIKASAVAASKKLKVKKHRKLKYESSNTKVATVSASGKIKAVAKGTCYIYVYAQNGVYARVKVKVKK